MYQRDLAAKVNLGVQPLCYKDTASLASTVSPVIGGVAPRVSLPEIFLKAIIRLVLIREVRLPVGS